jgi:hypothetical protein
VFELVLDVTDRFLNLRDTNAECAIALLPSLLNPSQYFFSYRTRNFVTPIIESVRTPARIRPYPTGRLFWVALSQALRARLRSYRPSGTTKAIRPSKGVFQVSTVLPGCVQRSGLKPRFKPWTESCSPIGFGATPLGPTAPTPLERRTRTLNAER